MQALTNHNVFLRALQTVRRFVDEELRPYTDEWIEKAYNIYTTNLRKYLLDCYPNCTSDMRFFPIRDVPADHVVMGHAKSHVQSMLLQENNFNEVNVSDGICSNLNTYSDVIHYYACDLGSLPK